MFWNASDFASRGSFTGVSALPPSTRRTLPMKSPPMPIIHCSCCCESVLGGNLARGWMFRSRVVRQAAERLRVRPRCFLRYQRIALVFLDTCEGASHGSRITSMANRHSDSYHPRDLAIRRPARLSVTKQCVTAAPEEPQPQPKNHLGQKLQMRQMRRSARPSRRAD